MAVTGLLALLDDVIAILDDVAVLSKVAAQKTAGIAGDDLAVNRGLPWPRLREHLDALHRLRRDGEMRCSVTYSLVILRANLHELRAFAELARRDGVRYRDDPRPHRAR